MSRSSPTLEIDGEAVGFVAGETVLAVARRVGRDIPTLCHDPRLEPAGACRMCLVELEGRPRLQASCALAARDGMKVTTASLRIERHRRALTALYLADLPRERSPFPGQPDRLAELAERYRITAVEPRLSSLRRGRHGDPNPYIDFQPERCILCGNCVRYCREIEGVSALTLAGRGSATTIATADGRPLLETTCEMCGGCVAVCPTGAMRDRRSPDVTAAGVVPTRVRTTCNYCGVGCQLDLQVDARARSGRGRVVAVTHPPAGTSPNDGNLCVKGKYAFDFIDHPDRLTTPLMRDGGGRLRETGWEEALERVVTGLRRVQERHGRRSVGFVSSSRCTVEENYLVQKLARAVYGTNNVHQCAAT